MREKSCQEYREKMVALDMERLRLVGSVSTILRQQAGGLTDEKIKISHNHYCYTHRTIP